MKAAFACWENRIAPVFDTARRIHVVEVEAGRILRKSQVTLPGGPAGPEGAPSGEAGIGTLVCGAISGPLQGLVSLARHSRDPLRCRGPAGDRRGMARRKPSRRCPRHAPGCHGRGRLRRFLGAFDGERRAGTCPETGAREEERAAVGVRGGDKEPVREERGRAPLPGATESLGTCVCYQCGHREPHEPGYPLPCQGSAPGAAERWGGNPEGANDERRKEDAER
jgi:hypothetical protein